MNKNGWSTNFLSRTTIENFLHIQKTRFYNHHPNAQTHNCLKISFDKMFVNSLCNLLYYSQKYSNAKNIKKNRLVHYYFQKTLYFFVFQRVLFRILFLKTILQPGYSPFKIIENTPQENFNNFEMMNDLIISCFHSM